MSEFIVPILIAVLSSGAISALVTNLLTRRKLRAETGEIESRRDVNEAQEAETFADAIAKFMSTQESLQDRNRQLYEQIVILEKANTEAERSLLTLAERLADRDAQITTLTNHLKTLQDKDRQVEISNALVAQQQALMQVVDSYQRVIKDREKTIQDLKARTGPLPELPGHQAKEK